MKLYDAVAAHTYMVRLFALERGHVAFRSQVIDLASMENRGAHYRRTVNPRGLVPALELDNGFVITEVVALCEYLDEKAIGGTSLYGSNADERAETRTWLRRTDLEIAQPLMAWWRNDPETIDYYLGNRIPCPEARIIQKVVINQALNALEEELEGKTWLCGERFSAADIHFYGLVKMMLPDAQWFLAPARRNIKAYFDRMDERQTSQKALTTFEGDISL